MQNATYYFDQCLLIDKAAVNNGTAAADIHEVRLVNKQFKQLAYLMDQLFHYMYMGYEKIMFYRGNLNEVTKLFVWLWNHLPKRGVGFSPEELFTGVRSTHADLK